MYRVKDIGATLGSDPGSAVEFPFAVGDVVYFNAFRRTTGAEGRPFRLSEDLP